MTSNVNKTILFVPGFVADTYSEIEASFVELCSKPDDNIRFLWLVASGASKYDRYWKSSNRSVLSEPLYVTHLKRAGIPYIIGDISKYNAISNFLLFRRIFKDHPIDAVYTHFGFERFWATFFGKLWGRITIWNEHWYSLGTTHVFFKKAFYRFFVDYFISISQFIAQTLPKHARIFTVLNSIRVGEKQQKRNEEQRQRLRQKLGLDPSVIIVLMVASFTAQKRHTLALKICQALLAARKNVRFVFLGEGPEREWVIRKLREVALEEYFVLPGHVENVDEYYRVADISMFTGYNDGFGYTVLEAMSHSLPVVAFASGGPTEIVKDGVSGLLINEADAKKFVSSLMALIDDSERRSLMGQRARQAVEENFSRDAWTERVMDALRAIVVSDPVRIL
jgi:glycosyltransferase involved in cell wall biosynthesis